MIGLMSILQSGNFFRFSGMRSGRPTGDRWIKSKVVHQANRLATVGSKLTRSASALSSTVLRPVRVPRPARTARFIMHPFVRFRAAG
jgi:hypothetical protein